MLLTGSKWNVPINLNGSKYILKCNSGPMARYMDDVDMFAVLADKGF